MTLRTPLRKASFAVVGAAVLGLVGAGLFMTESTAEAQAPTPARAPAGDLTSSKEDAARYFRAPGFSPYAGRNFPTRVFWGEEHVHTSWSADAGGSGTSIDPGGAIRFARGEELVSSRPR